MQTLPNSVTIIANLNVPPAAKNWRRNAELTVLVAVTIFVLPVVSTILYQQAADVLMHARRIICPWLGCTWYVHNSLPKKGFSSTMKFFSDSSRYEAMMMMMMMIMLMNILTSL